MAENTNNIKDIFDDEICKIFESCGEINAELAEKSLKNIFGDETREIFGETIDEFFE